MAFEPRKVVQKRARHLLQHVFQPKRGATTAVSQQASDTAIHSQQQQSGGPYYPPTNIEKLQELLTSQRAKKWMVWGAFLFSVSRLRSFYGKRYSATFTRNEAVL